MATTYEVTLEVLSPLVGQTVADTCLGATALSVGKTADTLDREDLPTLERNVRRLLLPIAPSKTIDSVMEQIEGGVAP